MNLKAITVTVLVMCIMGLGFAELWFRMECAHSATPIEFIKVEPLNLSADTVIIEVDIRGSWIPIDTIVTIRPHFIKPHKSKPHKCTKYDIMDYLRIYL